MRNWIIARILLIIDRIHSKYPKWHNVCFFNKDGKARVYLDGRGYLVYNHKLSWRQKRKLKKHPFCMLRPFPTKAEKDILSHDGFQIIDFSNPLAKGMTSCLMDKPPE